MSAKAYARAQARETHKALALHRLLGRSMRLGEYTVQLSVSSLTADRQPRWHVEWSPSPPPRFSPADFALFEAFRRQAMADIRAELETDRR